MFVVGVAGAYLSEAPFRTGYLASLMFVRMSGVHLSEAPFRVGSWALGLTLKH
jgi:hypothetical protein